jgi:hypothetical protein
MARPVWPSSSPLSVQAQRAAAELDRLADRWIDGPPPSPEELRSVADDLHELLLRVTVARADHDVAPTRRRAGGTAGPLSA